jgi:hypothetical protein
VAGDVVRSGCVLVLGDDPYSVDSRLIGYVRCGSVLGTVVRRMA